MQIGKSQILVLGPPGCGKTTDLLTKVDQCLADGIKPNRIAFVSFTRKAVGEALQRACSRFKLNQEDFPFFKTIHSLCFSLLECTRMDMMGVENLRELGQSLGYQFDGTFDESETGMPQGAKEGDKLLFMDNFARVTMTPLKQFWNEANADVQWHALERMSIALQRYKEAQGLLDFTDLLARVVERQFHLDLDVAVIDEAQDLSKLQWAVIQTVFANVPRVYIAGDDDQSIYKWSGADVDTFLKLKGKKELLTQSHRVPVAVYNQAQKIIGQISERYVKPYKPKEEQGQVNLVTSADHIEFRDNETTLCLARNVYLLKRFVPHLQNHGFKYSMRGGHSSVKKGHIEAILAWTALTKGEAVPARQVKYMYEQMRIGPYLQRGAKASIGRLHDKDLVTAEDLRKNHGLLQLGIWHDALDNIDMETREYYLSILRAGRRLQAHPTVAINTIHGVKGGEADHVVLLSDMSFESFKEYQRTPANEHRVAYVGVTRAKQRLTIVQPQSSFAYRYY